MAGDWIKMRTGLRKNPKTILMANYLSSSREFMDWWSDPVRKSCDNSVTELVTMANVTRVTVCGLLEVWGSVNESIGESGLIKNLSLQIIDDIADIPGFGEAMKYAGWVIEREQGIEFPNFSEHNVPDKQRKGPAKTNAQRQAEYRERKRQKEACNESNESNGREEKRREDNNRGFSPPSVEEVREYCKSRNNGIDPEQFVAFYGSKGWMIGKNKMKDWKQAIITWESQRKQNAPEQTPTFRAGGL